MGFISVHGILDLLKKKIETVSGLVKSKSKKENEKLRSRENSECEKKTRRNVKLIQRNFFDKQGI